MRSQCSVHRMNNFTRYIAWIHQIAALYNSFVAYLMSCVSLSCFMMLGLSKGTFAIHQSKHQAAGKMGSQHGESRWPLVMLIQNILYTHSVFWNNTECKFFTQFEASILSTDFQTAFLYFISDTVL